MLRLFAWNFGQGAKAPDVTVRVAFNDTVERAAVMEAVMELGTGLVVTVNSALVAPAAIVTTDGVLATGSLDDRLIVVPPGPAGAFNVTVPIDDVPPTTDVGARVKLAKTAGGLIARVAVTETVPSLAVIVALINAATVEVATVNVAVVAPATTVTLDGIVALGLPEDKATTDPPVGAGASRVTVPIEVAPPRTEVGSRVTLASADEGVIASVVVAVAVPNLAVIVAEVAAVTVDVVVVKVANEEPAGTVTLAGTTALVLLEVNETAAPPEPACPVNVTVPVEDLPPRTDGGAIATLRSVAGVTVRVAVADWRPDVAVMTADVLAVTPVVVIGNVAVVAPPGTITNPGTTADVLLLPKSTSAPPFGAGCERVTVPVEAFPPTTEAGFMVRLNKVSVVV